jgi:hypothetical protein
MLMKVERPSLEVPPTFQRLYMSLTACKKGFRRACRHVIGVDGCFLKGHYKGKLLAAIVEAKTTNNWSLFLETLVADLGPNGSIRWTFISDR